MRCCLEAITFQRVIIEQTLLEVHPLCQSFTATMVTSNLVQFIKPTKVFWLLTKRLLHTEHKFAESKYFGRVTWRRPFLSALVSSVKPSRWQTQMMVMKCLGAKLQTQRTDFCYKRLYSKLWRGGGCLCNLRASDCVPLLQLVVALILHQVPSANSPSTGISPSHNHPHLAVNYHFSISFFLPSSFSLLQAAVRLH